MAHKPGPVKRKYQPGARTGPKRDHRVHWLAVQWVGDNLKLSHGRTSCDLHYAGAGRTPMKIAKVDEEVTCEDCLIVHAKNREKDRAFLEGLKPLI